MISRIGLVAAHRLGLPVPPNFSVLSFQALLLIMCATPQARRLRSLPGDSSLAGGLEHLIEEYEFDKFAELDCEKRGQPGFQYNQFRVFEKASHRA